MGATIAIVTPEEHAAALRRIERLEKLLGAYVSSQDEWLPKEQAIRIAGLKTEEPGHIKWRKTGAKCLYLRSSCIDYAQCRLGQPALAA
jgi:hypothetical protein